MLSLWKQALLSPSGTIACQLQKNNVRWKDGFFHLSLAFMIAIPSAYALSHFFVFMGIADSDSPYVLMPLIARSFWLLLLGIFAESFLVDMGGLIVCGQSNAKRVFCLLSIFSSPLALLNVPYLTLTVLQVWTGPVQSIFWVFSILLSIYAAYFVFILVKRTYSLNSVRAIIAFFIAFAILAILAIILASIALFGGNLGTSLSIVSNPGNLTLAPDILKSNDYWANEAQPFALANHHVSISGSGELEIRNVWQKTLIINRIDLGNTKLSLIEQFMPGETKRIRIMGLPGGSLGQNYSFSLRITYVLPSGIESPQIGAYPILGKYE